jgi:hypothetical protein
VLRAFVPKFICQNDLSFNFQFCETVERLRTGWEVNGVASWQISIKLSADTYVRRSYQLAAGVKIFMHVFN